MVWHFDDIFRWLLLIATMATKAKSFILFSRPATKSSKYVFTGKSRNCRSFFIGYTKTVRFFSMDNPSPKSQEETKKYQELQRSSILQLAPMVSIYLSKSFYQLLKRCKIDLLYHLYFPTSKVGSLWNIESARFSSCIVFLLPLSNLP